MYYYRSHDSWKKRLMKTFIGVILGIVLFYAFWYWIFSSAGLTYKPDPCPDKLNITTYNAGPGFWHAFSEDYNKAKDGVGLDITCRKGGAESENKNWGYCQGTYRQGQLVDDQGFIKSGENWRIYFVVNLTAVEYIHEGTTSKREIYPVISLKCDKLN